MFKKAILLSAVLFLGACEEQYWRYGMTDDQMAADTQTCHQKALQAVPPGTGDYSAIHNAEKACMAQMGWHSSILKAPFLSLRGGERGD